MGGEGAGVGVVCVVYYIVIYTLAQRGEATSALLLRWGVGASYSCGSHGMIGSWGYMVGWLVGGLCIVSYFGTILGPGLILYNAAGSTIHVHDRTEEGEDARIRYERCCTQYHGLGSCPRVQVSFQLLICCCCWVSADGRVLRCGLFVFLCFFFGFWILGGVRMGLSGELL